MGNNKKSLPKDVESRLEQIGSNIASLWGGECYAFKVFNEEQEVAFDCIEHGEKFSTILKFSELAEYDY